MRLNFVVFVHSGVWRDDHYFFGRYRWRDMNNFLKEILLCFYCHDIVMFFIVWACKYLGMWGGNLWWGWGSRSGGGRMGSTESL